MRILERCSPSATPEVQVQIDTLREAFSQDTSQPFELKPSLGLRSPSTDSHPTPPGLQQSQPGASVPPSTAWPHLQDAASSKTMSPASDRTPSLDAATGQPSMPFITTSYPVPTQAAYAPVSVPLPTSTPQTGYSLEPVASNEQHSTPVWDPSGIFQQWNTAFGAQAQATPVQPPALDPRGQHIAVPGMPQPPHQPSPAASQQPVYSSQQTPPAAGTVMPEAIPAMPPVVTPVMWQDAFTNAYVSGHGHKRYRDESVDYGQYAKRRG